MKTKSVKDYLKPKSKENLIKDFSILSQKQLDETLLYAARYGHTIAIEPLLSSGANIEAKDNVGWTPLIWASCYGYKDVVGLLLDKGANIEAKSNSGWTPLMYASYNGRKDVVELLKNMGLKNR